jgi:hypothetical protein
MMGIVRFRRNLGSLERPKRQLDKDLKDLLNPDHDAKCRDLSRARPNASDP